MIPLLQLNKTLTYLFIALLLASFAFARSGQAVTPEPDLSTGEPNAAAGQLANEDQPNRRAFRFNFREMRQCASGNVTMGGELVVTFQNNVQRKRVKPEFVKVTTFNGTARSGDRKLKAMSVDIKDVQASLFGLGTFKIEMIVIGPALPGGRPLRFRVLFTPNGYRFEDGLVTHFMPLTSRVICKLTVAIQRDAHRGMCNCGTKPGSS
ncbi:MAG: hypothetical protein DME65_12590 [Verrucomicrobia bacterium]|nr:MAG: hypothetical protein DME65_12590 [Verrucomicrobiota bacterium]